MVGFEPTAPRSQAECATPALHPVVVLLSGIEPDPRCHLQLMAFIRRPVQPHTSEAKKPKALESFLAGLSGLPFFGLCLRGLGYGLLRISRRNRCRFMAWGHERYRCNGGLEGVHLVLVGMGAGKRVERFC